MRFRTKVDAWILILVSLAPLGLIAATVATGDWKVGLFGLVYLGLLSLLVWPCEYVLEVDRLVVRSGVIRWRVPYREIESVKPTSNPLSSPAWSLDRLWIAYGKRAVMVSPKDKGMFLEELARRAGLKRLDSSLIRT